MRPWLLVFVALAFAAPDVSASSREERKRLSTVENQFEQLRDGKQVLQKHSATAPHDFRGRTKADDVEQWVCTPEFEDRVESLLREARGPDDTAAKAALDEAKKLVDGALAKAQDVARYWDTLQVLRMHDHWTRFATANAIPVESKAGRLSLKAQQLVLEYLDAGDFVSAAIAGSKLETTLLKFMSEASSEISRTKNSESLTFISRSTPCPRADAPTAKARVSRVADPKKFYPSISKERDEQGEIIVRTRVPASGCASGFAIVVSSGYPALDQAALEVAEACHYSAGSENGRPIDSEMDFKVAFQLKQH